MQPKNLFLLAAGVATVQAWLPSDKKLSAFNYKTPSSKFDKRWLYGSGVMRGVNLGSMFIVEPWMLNSDTWSTTFGCGSACSEFDCVSALGQDAANTAWQNHWESWITTDDIQTMQSLGLNTIRIPLGYWSLESLVDSSEHFPQGQLPYLDALVGKASDLGMYVIIDLHGAPYAQVTQNPDTGQCASSAGFYQDSQYERAYTWLSWMTNRIHTTDAYRNVGMIEILNEPLAFGNQIQSEENTMVQDYYPGALNAVRTAESNLSVTSNNALHVMMMDDQWGAGNPKQSLPSDPSISFDDHEYLNGVNPGDSQQAYMSYVCSDNRDTDGDDPKVVGEFSMAITDQYQSESQFDPQSNKDWYTSYFTGQVQNYEKVLGWVYWSWKVEWSSGGDYRWDYQSAVANGIIPNSTSGLDALQSASVC